MRRLVVAAMAMAAGSPLAAAESCATLDSKAVAALFDDWNFALSSLEASQVVQRYWPNAVLLPTVSNTPRTSAAMIGDYFEHFLAKRPRGRIDTRTIQAGCNMAHGHGDVHVLADGRQGRDQRGRGALHLHLPVSRWRLEDPAPSFVGHAGKRRERDAGGIARGQPRSRRWSPNLPRSQELRPRRRPRRPMLPHLHRLPPRRMPRRHRNLLLPPPQPPLQRSRPHRQRKPRPQCSPT